MRNETSRVVNKLTTAQKTTTPSSSRSCSQSVANPSQQRASQPQNIDVVCVKPHPYFALTPPKADVALIYFIKAYISATSFEGYLAGFCSSDPQVDDACSSAIRATSQAAFARHARLPYCAQSARKEYLRALVHLNKALSKDETAILDRTLVAVLLLGLFEAIVFQGGRPPTSWTAHTFGAMQLLKMRGLDQFKSKTSIQLFAHASNNVKTSCIQRSVDIPSDFLELNEQAQVFLDPNDPAILLAPIIEKIAHMKALTFECPHYSILSEAVRLDQELVGFTRTVSGEWSYSAHSESKGSYNAEKNLVHKYCSTRMAKIWNVVRLLRAFLLSFIGDAATGTVRIDFSDSNSSTESSMPDDMSGYLAKLEKYATENLADVSAGVLASVPSFMELDGPDRRFLPPARSLAWPLTIIERNSLCPQIAKSSAAAYLNQLAGDLNMPQVVHPERDPGNKEDW